MEAVMLAAALALVAEGHPTIAPAADSVLVTADQNDHDEMIVTYREDNRRTRKSVEGRHWSLEYDVPGQRARDAIIDHFVAETERLQGVLHRDAGNQLTFSFLREDGGETWCEVWATDGNYTLDIVDEAPPGHAPFDDASEPEATIVFARNEAALDDGAERVLDAVANWLEAHPEMHAEIRGHRGPLEDPALVALRSAAVIEALTYRGISEGRLAATEDPSNQGFEVTVAAVTPAE